MVSEAPRPQLAEQETDLTLPQLSQITKVDDPTLVIEPSIKEDIEDVIKTGDSDQLPPAETVRAARESRPYHPRIKETRDEKMMRLTKEISYLQDQLMAIKTVSMKTGMSEIYEEAILKLEESLSFKQLEQAVNLKNHDYAKIEELKSKIAVVKKMLTEHKMKQKRAI